MHWGKNKKYFIIEVAPSEKSLKNLKIKKIEES